PQPPPAPPSRSSSAARPSDKAFRIAGFVEDGNTNFTASQSFEAILDKSSAPIIGGGAQLALPHGLFVPGEISHWSHNGERAFVNNGQVFKLGISETVEMTPIDVTAGYRLHFGKRRRSLTLPPKATAADRIVPYVGGGIGVVGYKETSQFA